MKYNLNPKRKHKPLKHFTTYDTTSPFHALPTCPVFVFKHELKKNFSLQSHYVFNLHNLIASTMKQP